MEHLNGACTVPSIILCVFIGAFTHCDHKCNPQLNSNAVQVPSNYDMSERHYMNPYNKDVVMYCALWPFIKDGRSHPAVRYWFVNPCYEDSTFSLPIICTCSG